MATQQVTVSRAEESSYHLDGDLNMDTVMTCWPSRDQDIQSAKQQKQSMSVDLQHIKQVDTSGLAWLVHLAQACHSQCVDLSLSNVPAGLINLAKLSNLDTILPLQ